MSQLHLELRYYIMMKILQRSRDMNLIAAQDVIILELVSDVHCVDSIVAILQKKSILHNMHVTMLL